MIHALEKKDTNQPQSKSRLEELNGAPLVQIWSKYVQQISVINMNYVYTCQSMLIVAYALFKFDFFFVKTSCHNQGCQLWST